MFDSVNVAPERCVSSPPACLLMHNSIGRCHRTNKNSLVL